MANERHVTGGSAQPIQPGSMNRAKPRSPWLVEYLIAPDLRDGRDATSSAAPDELEWLELEEQIAIWAKRGCLPEELGRLLEASPHTLEHPLVLRQLWHLHALASGFIQLSSYGVRDLIREAATADLKAVLSGFITGMLPDWQVTFRPTVSRGRPREVDPRDLLCRYKEQLSGMKSRVAKDRFLLVRRGDEDKAGFLQRLANVAADLYQNSSLSLRVSLGDGEMRLDSSWRKETLPDDHANRIATRAVNKPGRRASSKALIYGLLSYHYGKEPAEIAKLIDRAEAEDPDFARKIRWYKDRIAGRRR
jgi:hypothetical protein